MFTFAGIILPNISLITDLLSFAFKFGSFSSANSVELVEDVFDLIRYFVSFSQSSYVI